MKKLTLKLLIGAFSLMCFVSNVSAADLISAGESYGGWKSGLYIGGHAGYNTVDAELNGVDLDVDDLGGFAGGIHGGYNIVNGSLLYGIEADVSYLDSEQTDEIGCVVNEAVRVCAEVKSGLNYLASVRGRIGAIISDTTLIYVTGGVAWTEYEEGATVTLAIDGVTGKGSASEEYSETGYVIGGGAEMKITENVAIRAEVLHYGFDFDDYFGVEADMTVARGGITFLLN